MARYRTIKPEFWTSEQVMECSPIARLMFIGMWNFCDDAGRMVDSVKQIKALIFPSDDIDTDSIRRMIDELSSNKLIVRYVIEDKGFIQVTGWHHQKIDRPQPSKIPPPTGSAAVISSNGRRMVAPERKGEEGKGEDIVLPSGSNEPSERTHSDPAASQAGSEVVRANGKSRRKAKNHAVDYPSDFQLLWGEFPHHPNASKFEAYKSWSLLPEEDRDKALDGAMAYAKFLDAEKRRRPDAQGCHLVTYLNQRRWESLLEQRH